MTDSTFIGMAGDPARAQTNEVHDSTYPSTIEASILSRREGFLVCSERRPVGHWLMVSALHLIMLANVHVVDAGDEASGIKPGGVAAPPGIERHLTNIRQLTAGRQNAEAYFSFEGDKLVFQSTNDWTESTGDPLPQADVPPRGGLSCYQMYVLDLDTNRVRLVSKGVGATTCGYFFPGGRRVLYSSTHGVAAGCPPKPDRQQGYRWALDDYDIYSVRLDGQQMQRLTSAPGYDAEATVSPDGKTIVWTSLRDGDLNLYAMNLDGTHMRRLTTELGYDGGAFFSPDSRRIVYRAQHPQTPEEVDEYRSLLQQRLVKPNRLEIFVMDADGSHKQQVTNNGASNFAPYFHPDGRRIIFASNGSPGERAFQLYLIKDDGTGLESVTAIGNFNSFPMFSPDGKRLVWVSDRNATKPGEFNIFLADWVP